MIGLITKGIAKIFGTKSARDIKEILPYVDQTNEEHAKLTSLTNDELRGQTKEVTKYIDDKLAVIDAEITALHKKVEDNPDLDIHEKEEVFNQIDKLEETRNVELEEVLLEVLAKAFAIVKETARRFKENDELVVTATMHDKVMAAKHSHVELDGENAIWQNRWKYNDSSKGD